MDDHPLALWLSKTSTTQAELAQLVKVAQPSISNYLKGERGMSEDTAEAIALVTGISRDVLLFESPRREKKKAAKLSKLRAKPAPKAAARPSRRRAS